METDKSYEIISTSILSVAGLGSLGQAGMTLLQQQILSQYALMNGLMGQQQQQIQQQQQQQQQKQLQQQQSKPVEPPAKKIKTSRDRFG